MNTRWPSAFALSTTSDSYAGTTPLRGVGKATCFTCWTMSRPSTLRFCQPRARFTLRTSLTDASSPTALADLTQACAGETATSPPASARLFVRDEEAYAIFQPLAAEPVSPTVTRPASAVSSPPKVCRRLTA
jgi:hypothetical protein